MPDDSKSSESLGLSDLSGLSGVRIGVPTRLPPAEDEGVGFQPPSKIDLKEHEARTASRLTYVLVGMLAATFVIQVALIVFMSFHKPDALPILQQTFNQWLPVLAGLVGTAVGFYLKERK